MRNNKMLATLPAWALVIALVALGSGSTWGHHYNRCCDAPSIDIDQENYGYGHYRTNYANASIDNSGYRWGYHGSYGGGEIDIDQENVGNGNYRDNLAFADIDAGGYGGWGWGWGYRSCCQDNSIDIDQENYGNGNNRDNAAYATWSW